MQFQLQGCRGINITQLKATIEVQHHFWILHKNATSLGTRKHRNNSTDQTQMSVFFKSKGLKMHSEIYVDPFSSST